jgi:hypothetical protein
MHWEAVYRSCKGFWHMYSSEGASYITSLQVHARSLMAVTQLSNVKRFARVTKDVDNRNGGCGCGLSIVGLHRA